MSIGKNDLGMARAFLNALWGRDISYFPRFPISGESPSRLSEADIIKAIEGVLPSGECDKVSGDALAEHCRETLDEVKGLTEYQDQKATRLLTIVAFLSALSGALFSRLADSYPLMESWKKSGAPVAAGLVMFAYVAFAAFVLLAVCGALVIFHATRTHFKYPKSDGLPSGNRGPSSVLFYAGIVGVKPEEWARAFLAAEDQQVSWDSGIRARYIRNYIVESYLVAAKVADKLPYLQPGQNLLLWSIRALFALVLSLALVVGFVSPKEPASKTLPAATEPSHQSQKDAATGSPGQSDKTGTVTPPTISNSPTDAKQPKGRGRGSTSPADLDRKTGTASKNSKINRDQPSNGR